MCVLCVCVCVNGLALDKHLPQVAIISLCIASVFMFLGVMVI